MDSFCEQLVKKKRDGKYMLYRFLIIIGMFSVSFFLTVIVMFILRNFTLVPLLLLALIGIFYGGFKLQCLLNIEYEYCVTNGGVDVDIIKAKSQRKRLCSFSVKNVSEIGKYSQRKNDCNTVIFACEDINDTENTWYLTFRSKQAGIVQLVFSPDEKTMNEIKKYLPGQVLRASFKE